MARTRASLVTRQFVLLGLITTVIPSAATLAAAPPPVADPIHVASLAFDGYNMDLATAGDVVAVQWNDYDGQAAAEHPTIAVSDDGGRTFSPPVVFADDPFSAFGHVQVLDDGTVLTSALEYEIVDEPALGEAWKGVMAFARSTDGGASFTPISDLGSVMDQRFIYPTALAASPDGRIVIGAWQDMSPTGWVPDGEAAATGDGRQPVWAAVSLDGGASFGDPQLIDAQGCGGCLVQAFVAGDRAGVAFSAARLAATPAASAAPRRPTAVGPGSGQEFVIDPMVASADSLGTFAAAVPVHLDGFTTAGMPTTGPGAAAGPDGRIHVAWWTGAKERPGIWYATSEDGATFGEPVLLEAAGSVAGSVEVTVDGAGTAWILAQQLTDVGATLRLWQVPDGQAPVEVVAAATDMVPSDDDGFDVAGLAAGGALVAWIDGKDVQLRRVGP